jgi:hypothetical protein
MVIHHINPDDGGQKTSETLGVSSKLTRLIARENFITNNPSNITFITGSPNNSQVHLFQDPVQTTETANLSQHLCTCTAALQTAGVTFLTTFLI